jgi:hypothetical protein
MSGAGIDVPRISVRMSRTAMSRNMRGTIFQRSNPRRLASIVFSDPAPPAT